MAYVDHRSKCLVLTHFALIHDQPVGWMIDAAHSSLFIFTGKTLSKNNQRKT